MVSYFIWNQFNRRDSPVQEMWGRGEAEGGEGQGEGGHNALGTCWLCWKCWQCWQCWSRHAPCSSLIVSCKLGLVILVSSAPTSGHFVLFWHTLGKRKWNTFFCHLLNLGGRWMHAIDVNQSVSFWLKCHLSMFLSQLACHSCSPSAVHSLHVASSRAPELQAHCCHCLLPLSPCLLPVTSRLNMRSPVSGHPWYPRRSSYGW